MAANPDTQPDKGFRPDFSHERALLNGGGDLFASPNLHVIGIDEAGRGPWAGPVTAGAAWINPDVIALLPAGIDDSKRLNPARRAALWEQLQRLAEDAAVLRVATASTAAEVIDEQGILSATFAAMEAAALGLELDDAPLHALVDGTLTPRFAALAGQGLMVTPLPKGDQRSLSIAVAAIAAKQTRDAEMIALDAEFPGYGWKDNMGYGTRDHAEALTKQGPSPQHRLSFRPVAAAASAHGYTR